MSDIVYTSVTREFIEGAQFESISEGSKVSISVKTGSSVEIIEYDKANTLFSMTTNGNKVIYDRRDYCIEAYQSGTSRKGALASIINSTDPYYGSPYNNVLNGH